MYIINIGTLYGILNPGITALKGPALSKGFSAMEKAWIKVDDEGLIECFGEMAALKGEELIGHRVHDARGALVLPTFADSHTHIIYAGSREKEFGLKIAGASYEEIAANGGGILNSVDRLRATSVEELGEQALARARRMMAMGTGAIEIKSGYGLSVDDEIKMLQAGAYVASNIPARVRLTFLGAHAVAREYAGRQGEYVDMLIREMLPAVAAEGLAQYVDVFCDKGFFTVHETDRILDAAAKYGLKPKIHANELDNSGGVQVGIKHGAISVDHLERAGQEEVEALACSHTIATCLPGASFFLDMPYAPARQLIDGGAQVALASDYNPGSSPSGDMRFVWTLACTHMRMTPAEAFAAATINGAAAMELSAQCGSIAPRRDASFVVCRPGITLDYIPYSYTEPWIDTVFIRGHKI